MLQLFVFVLIKLAIYNFWSDFVFEEKYDGFLILFFLIISPYVIDPALQQKSFYFTLQICINLIVFILFQIEKPEFVFTNLLISHFICAYLFNRIKITNIKYNIFMLLSVWFLTTQFFILNELINIRSSFFIESILTFLSIVFVSFEN